MGAAPRIVLIHATPVSVEPVRQAMAALWPAAEAINLLDDALAVDRARAAELTADIHDRIGALADYARRIGAQGILFTCSAFGPAIEAAARRLDVPVLKPNEAMFAEAFALGGRIGMVATFAPAAVTMTEEFTEDAARLRPGSKLSLRVVQEARTALDAGDGARHDRLVAEAAGELGTNDVLMLAHFSTASAAAEARRQAACPVLTAPGAAVRMLRRLVEAK